MTVGSYVKSWGNFSSPSLSFSSSGRNPMVMYLPLGTFIVIAPYFGNNAPVARAGFENVGDFERLHLIQW